MAVAIAAATAFLRLMKEIILPKGLVVRVVVLAPVTRRAFVVGPELAAVIVTRGGGWVGG